MADLELQPLCMDLLKLGASHIFLDAVFDAIAVVVHMVSWGCAALHMFNATAALHMVHMDLCLVLPLTLLLSLFTRHAEVVVLNACWVLCLT